MAYAYFLACGLRPGNRIKSLLRTLSGLLQKTLLYFQPDKPEKLFHAAKSLVTVFPKEKTYKLLIQQSIQQPNHSSSHVERLRRKINKLTSTLPEYNTVMASMALGSPIAHNSLLRSAMCPDSPTEKR